MSAIDAEVAARGVPGQQPDEELEREQKQKEPKETAWTRIRARLVVVDAEIPPEVASALEAVAWSPEPVLRLAKFMKERSKKDWDALRIGWPFAIFLCLLSLGEVTYMASRSRVWASVFVIILFIVGVVGYIAQQLLQQPRRDEETHATVKARLLGNLVRALSACIDLQKNALNMNERGGLARNIEAASSRFDRIYRRLPGHRAKMYAAELKAHARSGAQAIASMTSLLFAGPDGLAALSDRLARAILRIEADDWLCVAQLGIGGEVAERKRLFRYILEPTSIPLIVGGLALLTAVVSAVGKILDL